MVLAVGIPLTLVCLACFVGTAAIVLSCLVIRSRKKGKRGLMMLGTFLTHSYITHMTLQKEVGVSNPKINKGIVVVHKQ